MLDGRHGTLCLVQYSWGLNPGFLHARQVHPHPQRCMLHSFLGISGGMGTTVLNAALFSTPGHQFYHSLLCVVLQFLILRLMGRTITAVLTTLCLQMVIIFFSWQLRSHLTVGVEGARQGVVAQKPRRPSS